VYIIIINQQLLPSFLTFSLSQKSKIMHTTVFRQFLVRVQYRQSIFFSGLVVACAPEDPCKQADVPCHAL
jgi:hypothetical protein